MGETNDFGPLPGRRALTVEVVCRTSRRTSRGRKHPVTITADWALETPHDLEAERIAAAFGGYSSCLELAEAGVPALRAAIGLLTRRARPALSRRDEGGWLVRPVTGCGCSGPFPTACAAAEHARSPRHLALQHGCPERTLRALLEATRAAVAAPDTVPCGHHRVSVREPDGLRTLWAAGVHPDELPHLAAAAAGVTDPLPVLYYLALVYHDVARGFLARALPARPDPDTATWVAWLPPALQRAEACRTWLELGLGRRQVVALLEADVATRRVQRLAADTGLPPRQVAQQLAEWAAVGCRPEARHLRLLAEHGVAALSLPSRTALDELETHAARVGDPPARTELAVLLALAGTRHDVRAALARGVRTAAQLGAAEEAG